MNLRYFFKNWQDGDKNMEKVIVMTGDLTLTAYYEEGFALAVTSLPINVAFTINQLPLQTPYNQTLIQGIYTVTMPTVVGDYRFKQWEDGSTNPIRTINLAVDTSMIATYELPPPPPPTKGRLSIHAFLDSDEIATPYEVIGTGFAGTTPDLVEVDAGIYEVKATYGTQIKTVAVDALGGQTVRVDISFTVVPPTSILPILIMSIAAAAAALGYIFL